MIFRTSRRLIICLLVEHLFDDFVGKLLQLLRDVEAKCLGSPEIYDELIFCRCLHGKISRLFPLENAISINCGKPKLIPLLTSVRQEAAHLGEEAPRIDSRKVVASCQRNDRGPMNVQKSIWDHN